MSLSISISISLYLYLFLSISLYLSLTLSNNVDNVLIFLDLRWMSRCASVVSVGASARKRGCFPCSDGRCVLQVLNMHGKVLTVRHQAVNRRKDNRSALALDSEQNNIHVKDIVKVIDGPHSVSRSPSSLSGAPQSHYFVCYQTRKATPVESEPQLRSACVDVRAALKLKRQNRFNHFGFAASTQQNSSGTLSGVCSAAAVVVLQWSLGSRLHPAACDL